MTSSLMQRLSFIPNVKINCKRITYIALLCMKILTWRDNLLVVLVVGNGGVVVIAEEAVELVVAIEAVR